MYDMEGRGAVHTTVQGMHMLSSFSLYIRRDLVLLFVTKTRRLPGSQRWSVACGHRIVVLPSFAHSIVMKGSHEVPLAHFSAPADVRKIVLRTFVPKHLYCLRHIRKQMIARPEDAYPSLMFSFS